MNMADVAEDAYYAEAVRWALSQGITTGTGDGKFSPDAACTRAQIVTFLWRAFDKSAGRFFTFQIALRSDASRAKPCFTFAKLGWLYLHKPETGIEDSRP